MPYDVGTNNNDEQHQQRHRQQWSGRYVTVCVRAWVGGCVRACLCAKMSGNV
jgi:hypothetical protein